LAQLLRQIPLLHRPDADMVDQAQPVPHPFKTLQKPDQPGVVAVIQAAVSTSFTK
jgi:hypothetical protein